MLVSDVIDRVRGLLQDSAGVRWVDAELFRFIDDAQVLLGDLIPEAVSKVVSHALVAGAEQSLPADGIALLKIKTDPQGRRPRAVDKDTLDLLNPEWMDDSQDDVIRNYMRDETEKLKFWVYPPSVGSVNASIEYHFKPVAVTATTDSMSANDEYLEFFVDYTLYRAYDKDAEIESNSALAQSHFERALSRINLTPRSPHVMAAVEGSR